MPNLTENVLSADNQQGRSAIGGNPQRLYVKCPDIEELDPNEVIILAILYTDGCLSPKRKSSWRLFLGNTSWQVIQLFKNSLINLFDVPEKRIRIVEKQVNGKLHYPLASLPAILTKDKKTICQFLKVAFSCDGGINLYVARNKYIWLIRNVYLACQHPRLIKQYYLLLRKLGIAAKILFKDELIRIQGRVNIEKFAREIGFLKGVKITQNSAYWQGIEKQKILELAITSYGDPKLVYNLPQFRVKR